MVSNRNRKQHIRALMNEDGISYQAAGAQLNTTGTASPPDLRTGSDDDIAASSLPTLVPFPLPGTPDFEEWNTLAREGKFRIGAANDGWVTQDFTTDPHLLAGGSAGSGKTVLLSLITFGALNNPNKYELWIAAPNQNDFSWAAEFPGCRRFGDTDERIIELVRDLTEEMDRRLSLLDRRGVRNVRHLRRLYVQHQEYEAEDDPAPRRLILIFDDTADFLGRGWNKDLQEAKDEARAHLVELTRRGRAAEIHLVATAQKPDEKTVSSQLRTGLSSRACLGLVDRFTSQQIMDSQHGTRFPPNSPPGRAWFRDAAGTYTMMQTMALSQDDYVYTDYANEQRTAVMPGSDTMLRARMKELGLPMRDRRQRS